MCIQQISIRHESVCLKLCAKFFVDVTDLQTQDLTANVCYVVLIFVLVSCLQIPKECDFCTLQGEIKIGVYDAYLYN